VLVATNACTAPPRCLSSQELIEALVRVESDWIPGGEGYSLYLRPTAISTTPSLGVGPAKSVRLYVICSPCGPYYRQGFVPVKVREAVVLCTGASESHL
jgi:branched-subunit amino acid aminotransferase/4-amino-4-deoxychorismate lyase